MREDRERRSVQDQADKQPIILDTPIDYSNRYSVLADMNEAEQPIGVFNRNRFGNASRDNVREGSGRGTGPRQPRLGDRPNVAVEDNQQMANMYQQRNREGENDNSTPRVSSGNRDETAIVRGRNEAQGERGDAPSGARITREGQLEDNNMYNDRVRERYMGEEHVAPFCDEPSSGGNSPDSDRSYADVTSKYKWNGPKPKKRKMNKTAMKDVPELKAVRSNQYEEYYVQGLDYTMCATNADFEYMIEVHCRRRGVNPVDVCTIPVFRSRVKAGCKITVRGEDGRKINAENFWPEDASVRPWEERPRNRKQDGNDNDYGY